MFRAVLFGGFVLIALLGCTSQAEKDLRTVKSQIATVEASIRVLREHLNAGRIYNAKILKTYAKALSDAQPELTEFTDALAIEATVEGALFQSLPERLSVLKKSLPVTADDPALVLDAGIKLREISFAAQTEEFNRALADPINVLADLSNSMLGRIDAVGVGAETGVDENTLAPGTQLVGNPHYGEWRNDSSGGSFWSWYGQYAMLRLLLGGNDYYYGGWAANRRYSYYHDYGRAHYTSPQQRTQAKSAETRARQKFSQSGKTFQSPYARLRTGASRRVTAARTSMLSPRASSRARSGVSSRSGSRGK